MNLDEMKELYDSGDYYLCTKHQGCDWRTAPFDEMFKKIAKDLDAYKLIHKKHKDILDAYLADDGVEIWKDPARPDGYGQTIVKDWINNYNENVDYFLTKPKHNIVTDFTNTYCEASELHSKMIMQYCLDNFIDKKATNGLNPSLGQYANYYFIDIQSRFLRTVAHHSKPMMCKQIHYNTDINEWVYTEEKEDNNIKKKNDKSGMVKSKEDTKVKGDRKMKKFELNSVTSLEDLPLASEEHQDGYILHYVSVGGNGGSKEAMEKIAENSKGLNVVKEKEDEHPNNNIISIKDDSSKEYLFEKPEFECELLKVRIMPNEIIGTIELSTHSVLAIWSTFGVCVIFDTLKKPYMSSKHDLTPIKPKWYEDESNFPAWMTDSDGKNIYKVIKKSGIDFLCEDNDTLLNGAFHKLATKEEVLSLYYQDKN